MVLGENQHRFKHRDTTSGLHLTKLFFTDLINFVNLNNIYYMYYFLLLKIIVFLSLQTLFLDLFKMIKICDFTCLYNINFRYLNLNNCKFKYKKNCQKEKIWKFLAIFFFECQVFGNFLTVKWQFSGGSDTDTSEWR